MKIQKLNVENISLSSDLIIEIVSEKFINILSSKGINTLLKFYNKENITKRFSEINTTFYQFITNDNILAGIAEMDKNHIVSLFIKKSYRGSKLATNFFEYLMINELVKNEITVYSTPLNIEFYVKNGFIQESINLREEHGIVFMPMKKIIS